MKRFQRKRRYRKRLLSLLLAAALVVQDGIPVMAGTPEQGEESESLTEESAADEDFAENASEESDHESDENVSESAKSDSEPESSTEEKRTAEETAAEETEITIPGETETETETETESETGDTETEESTATEEISADDEADTGTGSTNAEGGNVLKNGSFENTTTASGKYWKDDIVPTDYNDIWRAAPGTGGMTFAIEDNAEAKDGGKVFHISSTDNTARWDLAQPGLEIDPAKNYVCTFWVKADNVTGTGLYLMMKRKVVGAGTKETVPSAKITGTTNGWVQYEFTSDFPQENENGKTESIQIDIYAEYMTGDIWVDDIRVTPVVEEGALTMSRTALALAPGKTHVLTVSGADDAVVTWSSDNEEAATVDSDGMVTAVAEGKAVITAAANDKSVSCTVTVREGMIPDDKAVWWDDLETSVVSTDANMKKYWKDAEAPEGWTTGFNTAGNVKLQLVQDEVHTGAQAVYGSSSAIETSSKVSIYNVFKDESGKEIEFDYNKSYLLKVWIKTKDITPQGTWQGLLVRAGVGANAGTIAESVRIIGTNDWNCYEFELSSEKIQEALTKAAVSNVDSGKMKLEIVFEQMKGEVWIDSIELIEDYRLTLDAKRFVLDQNKTRQLKASGVPSDAVITWTSSDEKTAKVDENGLVTAVAPGKAVITAFVDETHSADCEVRVKDPADEVKYAAMRERWVNRLTGNHQWNGGDTTEDYQAVLDRYVEEAQKAWDLYKNDTNHADGIFGLTLDKKFGSTSGATASYSEPYYKVFQYIQNMAVAYAAEGSGEDYYQNADLRDAIIEALEWSYENIYNETIENHMMFGNWYHWWISIPQSLSGTIILMHDDLEKDHSELLENLAKALENFNEDPTWAYKVNGSGGQNKEKIEMTFANLADTSLASLLRGIACSDPNAVENGVEHVGEILTTVSSGDGIYKDGSLIQHADTATGKGLAYTAGYGATALNMLEKIFYLTDNTDWAVSADKSAPVWNWIWEGIRPLYADGAIFDMVNGRGMARPSSSDLKSGRGMLESMALLVKFAPSEWRSKLQGFVKAQLTAGIEGMGGQEEYFEGRNADAVTALKELLNDNSVVAAEKESFAKVFGSMDRAVAHNDRFSFGLSYSSARTDRFEVGDENKQGWHQGDGAVYLYSGDVSQYSDNYWNTVDNQRLAGITTDHSTWALKNWGHYLGNANLNGGSVAGPYATITMNFKNYKDADNPNLTARKSWFVFDDEVVALGTGISGIDTSRTTETIVDNKKINGSNKLIIDGEEQSTTVDGVKKSMADVSWAWLEGNTGKDSIGYYFPEGSKLDVLREARTGKWTDVNAAAGVDDTPYTRNYLSLAVPHGENAENKLDSFKKEYYSYVLLPGMSSEEVKAYAGNPDIQVLSNSTFVQAVADHKANAAGYIFWGDVTTPIRVGEVEGTVGSITIAKDAQTHTMRIGVADVHQNKDSLTFRIYGNNLSMAAGNEKVKAEFDKYGAVLTVDTKDAMGATVEVTLNYEDLPNEQLEEIATMRRKYADSLTGNDMSDKTDAEYLTYMKNYEDAASAALEQLNMDAGKGTKLFDDVELLDWANKGDTNGDGSASLVTTTTRIKDIVVAYKSEGTKYYNDPTAKAAIDVCLDYLMSGFPNILNYHDRVFGNWYHWSIGVPKDLTIVGILLYDDLDERYRDELYNMIQLLVPDVNYYWGRSTSGRAARYAATGANGSEMAMNTVLNGMIGNDPASLFKASDTMVNELRYVESGEGFYEDGSFKQHGNFAYSGSYGVEKLRAVTTLATVLNNTTWECADADSNIVYEWILNAFRPLYADGGIFDMVQGRSISRYNRSDITTGRYAMDAIVRLAATAPDKYKKALDSFAKTQAALGVAYDPASYYGGMKSLSSLVIVKNLINDVSIPLDTENYTKIYGSMDKAVSHGDGYALGFSMFSSRNGGVESINNENLKGWNTSDGALTLYNGDQGQFGEGFWATVDHTRLAGITTNHETTSMPGNNIKTNDRDWVGGSALNTENYASVGMDFRSTISDLEAKKSWFVFGDQIVALGAGIATTAGDYTETIVENRKIDGSNRLLVDGKEAVASNGTEQTAANWAWLSANAKGSAIGYYFPEETQVTVKRETRTGKWSEVNANLNAGDADEVTKDYISIAVEHGAAPTDAAYGYVLLPGMSSEEMEAYADSNHIAILSNTKQLQAAADTDSGVSGYNFWTAGESVVPEQNGIAKMTSDAPVSVTMLNDGNKNIHLAISDPTQKGGTITLRLEGTGLTAVSADDAVAMSADDAGITLTVNVSGKSGGTLKAVIASANAKPSETAKYVTVTLHYPDETIKKETITVDTKFAEPEFEAEDESGTYGIRWYTDETKTVLYDFDAIVSQNLDLYGAYYYHDAETKVTAAFHYPDGKTETVTVNRNAKLTKPEFEAEDEKGKYGVKWYADEAKTVLYDFDTAVLTDLDLYGKYYYYGEGEGGDDKKKASVTFLYPDGKSVTVTLEPNDRAKQPEFEAEDENGKYGILWYADEAQTELYDFDAPVTEDISLYGVYSYYYEKTDKDEDGKEEIIKTGIRVLRIENRQYTGKAIKPEIVVYDGTTRLREKTDYKVSYKNNKKVGTASVTITPCGNYEKASRFTVNFEIVPRTLTKENVTINYTPVMNVKFDKKNEAVAQTPKKAALKYGTVTVPAKEYTVTYMRGIEPVEKLTEAGTYQMVIATKEGSSFDARLSYDIVLTDKILMSALKISVPEQTWTGEALTPDVSVKYKNKNVSDTDGKELRELFDIAYTDNVDAGTAAVTLTAKSDSPYYGSRTVNFKIRGTEITKAYIEGFQSALSYTGQEIRQNVTLVVDKGKASERILQEGEGKDYTIDYSNNVNAGKAVMTITGMGAFSGTVKKTFTVGKVNLKNAESVAVSFADPESSKVPQDKSGAKPAVRVVYGEKLLVQDIDYKVSYSGNKAVGTNGAVTVKGIGNYAGDLRNILSFEITPKDIAHNTMSIVAEDLKYAANGKYKVKIAAYDNGVKLSSSEYSVSAVAEENVDVNPDTGCGTVTVTVEGRKNYTGTRSVAVQVRETLLSSAKIKVKGTCYYDNGAEVSLSESMLEVTVGSGKNKVTLNPQTDFIIERCDNNTRAGNATATVKGVGKYGGTKSVKYKILPKWMQRKS